ncbi:MAG: hypothetical protein AAF518_12055 [Spirochaetota bacterium]
MNKPGNTAELSSIPDFSKIQEKLREIPCKNPFELVFYGSRARQEHASISDYNFYLIASPLDQLNTDFIQSIGKALDSLEEDASVSLVAGDKDSFRMRMSIFEPTAAHLCETGIVVFGNDQFTVMQKEWQDYKNRTPNFTALIKYLENRYNFYKHLKPRNTKEDVSRVEKVLQLNLQLWVLNHISDLTVTELWFMDIPSRLIQMMKELYCKDVPEEILLLVTIYEEIHELKQNIRMIYPYTDNQINKIKESILQIQDLSQILEKKN